jgi:hypothetical protein
MATQKYEPAHPLAEARYDMLKKLHSQLDGMPEAQKKVKEGLTALRKTEREILSYYDLTDMKDDK